MFQIFLRHYIKFHSHQWGGHLPLSADEETEAEFYDLLMIIYLVYLEIHQGFKVILAGKTIWFLSYFFSNIPEYLFY